jgi:hypothetical protein
MFSSSAFKFGLLFVIKISIWTFSSWKLKFWLLYNSNILIWAFFLHQYLIFWLFFRHQHLNLGFFFLNFSIWAFLSWKLKFWPLSICNILIWAFFLHQYIIFWLFFRHHHLNFGGFFRVKIYDSRQTNFDRPWISNFCTSYFF